MEALRLFIALSAPNDARAALELPLTDWRRRFPGIAWDEPGALHLTLQFIGAFRAERLPELEAALAAVAWDPFSLRLLGLGAFPDSRRPRILWAGVEAPPGLAHLAAGVAAATKPLGIEPELRPFTPHVSLARVKVPRAARGLEVGTSEPVWGEGLADCFQLFATDPKPTHRASRYRVLRTFASSQAR